MTVSRRSNRSRSVHANEERASPLRGLNRHPTLMLSKVLSIGYLYAIVHYPLTGRSKSLTPSSLTFRNLQPTATNAGASAP